MKRFKPCCFLPFVPLLKAGVPGDSDRVNGSAQSAQSLLLERSWHKSQGKGGPNGRPRTPAPGPITFRLQLDWIYPVLEDLDFRNEKGECQCAKRTIPPLGKVMA